MRDWFGAGWADYKGALRDAAFFPPRNHMEAQRWGWAGSEPRGWKTSMTRR